METGSESNKSKKDKNQNTYLRFTSVAIQMGVIIGGFTYLGVFLDKKQTNKTPIWTIVLSLFGVVISMYLIFKEVQKMNKD
jgi:ATP synthase protein I